MLRNTTLLTTLVATALSILLTDCTPRAETSARLPVLHLEELNRIGSVDDPQSALTMPIAVAVRDSVVYVVDGYPPRGTRFTKTGRWLGSFARSGDGPGELRSVGTLGITRDTVWVADSYGRRLELYGPDGEYLSSVRFTLDPDSLGAPSIPRALLPDGAILAGPGGIDVTAATFGRIDHATFSRTDRHGTAATAVHRQAVVGSDFFLAMYGDGRSLVGGMPLTQTPLTEPFPDGSGFVVVGRMAARRADSTSFTVKRYSADGTVAWTADVQYTPVSTDGFLDAWLAQRDSLYGLMPPDMGQAFRKALAVPPCFPPASEVVAGKDGTVWVRREALLKDSIRWDVFDPRGRRMATLLTSASTRILAASAAETWAVVTDSLDVPFLVRYAVR